MSIVLCGFFDSSMVFATWRFIAKRINYVNVMVAIFYRLEMKINSIFGERVTVSHHMP